MILENKNLIKTLEKVTLKQIKIRLRDKSYFNLFFAQLFDLVDFKKIEQFFTEIIKFQKEHIFRI